MTIHRRTFLRSSGIAMALPFLESMQPAMASESTAPKRMICIGIPFGFDPVPFIPTKTGRDYQLTSHLEHLKEFRDDFTVVSGLSHPNTGGGGHKAEAVMLTGAPYPDYSHNLKNTISVDQAFAAQFRGQTRYESFVLSTFYGTLSYTANGVAIPSINRPSAIFKKLFLATTPQEAEAELRRIDEGRSMLDFVGDQAKRLNSRISATDRQRVDEYFESVRDVERQLKMAREWVNRPKPEAIGSAPADVGDSKLQAKRMSLMVDMMHLALVTDSTRSISMKTFGMHHDLSHHGKEPTKLAACRKVEIELLQTYAKLLGKLKTSKEAGGSSLLDNTMVLMTSNLRDGNTHWTYNLPALLAGGGFRHGQHLAFNQSYLAELTAEAEGTKPERKIPVMGRDQQPLCNLFTSMLQIAGIESDRFGSAGGTLTGLDRA